MELWTEKYRPKALEEYVWRNPEQKEKVQEWLKQGSLPHLLLTGVQGSGKTSLAKMLLGLLKVNRGDILEINASRERNADTVQNKILNFCTTWALGDMKYVLLDEADSMSPLAQRILRGEMETYADSVRFILTGNYPNKIIPALHSRCQGFHFEALDLSEFTNRVVDILINEGVQLETEEDVEILNEYVEKTHPDLRKCINLLQQNVIGNKLRQLNVKDASGKDYLLEVANLFRSGQVTEGRKLIVESAQPEEYNDIYRFFYQNLDMWGQGNEDEAVLIIRNALVNHSLVADVEINLSACLIELNALRK